MKETIVTIIYKFTFAPYTNNSSTSYIILLAKYWQMFKIDFSKDSLCAHSYYTYKMRTRNNILF